MKASTYLMFEGQAEEAVNFYASVIPGLKIISPNIYSSSENGKGDSLEPGSFELCGQHFMFFDSPVKHQFTFTPATSIFLTCDTEEEVDALFAALSEGGSVMMPLDAYPFSKRFAWIADRFGVSWQLSVA